MAEPSSRSPIRAGSLSIIDPAGQPYQGAWVGMANDVEGDTEWLRAGGIADRVSLDADRVRVRSRLEVGGDLRVEGDQNVIDVFTQTLIVQNVGTDQAGTWRVDFPGRFERVYAAYAALQGFSVFGASVAPDFAPPTGHMTNDNVIPQHVVVRVDEVAADHVSGTAYTSESNAGYEGDNRTLFSVMVLGKPAA
jgi:hypothetical protein